MATGDSPSRPSRVLCHGWCLSQDKSIDVNYYFFYFNFLFFHLYIYTIRVASFWMLCDFGVWAPSQTGWSLASISCKNLESRWLSGSPMDWLHLGLDHLIERNDLLLRHQSIFVGFLMNWILLRQDKNIHFKQDRTYVTQSSFTITLLFNFHTQWSHFEPKGDYKISF